MLNYSISRRNIYPGLDTDLNLSMGDWAYSRGEHINSTLTFDHDDHPEEEQGNTLAEIEAEAKQISEAYHDQHLDTVIHKGRQLLKAIRETSRQGQQMPPCEEQVLLVKGLVGNSLIKKYRLQPDKKLLQQAEKLLKERRGEEEPPERKAKRLNNIGIC